MTRTPLAELWTESGPLEAERGRDLGADDVRAHLRNGCDGVVASLGQPLRWLRGVELFEWWKSEARPRLVPADVEAFRLEDFPGERCWCATEWRLGDGTAAILFEENH